jgi:outer membrane protein assembly factor BamB
MRTWIGLFVLVVVACSGSTTAKGGAPFSEAWKPDQGRSIAALEERLRAQPALEPTPVVIGVGATELTGMTLDGRKRFRHPGGADTLPWIAGSLVIASDAGAVYAVDVLSGRQLWSLPTEGRKLRGAGDDGRTSVLVLAGENPGKSRFLAVTRAGEIKLQIDSTVELGVPAARGGIGFLPWGDQYVSAVDLNTGVEVARLLLREVVTHARNFAGDLWFGEKGLVRFDGSIRLATTNQGTRLGLPNANLPGKPTWLGSGNQLWLVNDSARLKIRLAATPVADDKGLHFASDTYLATYFRVVLGLSTQNGDLRFVHSLGADALAASAGRNGFAVCDASGKVTLLSARGGPAGSLDLDERLRGCVVEATAQTFQEQRAPEPLSQQLGTALSELSPDMAVAQRYLLDQLVERDEPIVTKILIDLSSSSKIPPDLRSSARKLIATRRSGRQYMLAALERHYDYVSDVLLPPPLGPLADALASMNETAAAPLLARHLNDPATDMADVERAAIALEKLATSAEYNELRTFFALYRATADEPKLVSAVVAVAKALLRIGGQEGRAVVERAAADPLTQVDVKRGITPLLEPTTPKAAGHAERAELGFAVPG